MRMVFTNNDVIAAFLRAPVEFRRGPRQNYLNSRNNGSTLRAYSHIFVPSPPDRLIASLFSYGTEIARWVHAGPGRDPVLVISTSQYTSTTSRHQKMLRMAAQTRGMPFLGVRGNTSGGIMMDLEHMPLIFPLNPGIKPSQWPKWDKLCGFAPIKQGPKLDTATPWPAEPPF